MDVSNTFLFGDLDKDVFMRKPLHFMDTNQPQNICKLHKALYRLKQGLQSWC